MNRLKQKKYIACTTGKLATICKDFERVWRRNEHVVRDLVDRAAKCQLWANVTPYLHVTDGRQRPSTDKID